MQRNMRTHTAPGCLYRFTQLSVDFTEAKLCRDGRVLLWMLSLRKNPQTHINTNSKLPCLCIRLWELRGPAFTKIPRTLFVADRLEAHKRQVGMRDDSKIHFSLIIYNSESHCTGQTFSLVGYTLLVYRKERLNKYNSCFLLLKSILLIFHTYYFKCTVSSGNIVN